MLKPPVFEYAVQLLLSAAILRIIFYKNYEICDIKKWIIKVVEGLPNLLRVFREGLA